MRPHDLANDEKPEAKAARALVALLEWLEKKGDPVRRDWFAFVPDGDDDMVPFNTGGGDCYRASAVLDGVRDQVGDRLLYPRLVPGAGKAARGLQLNSSNRMSGPHLVDDGLRHRAQIHRGAAERDAVADATAGEVEDVPDHARHALSASVDHVDDASYLPAGTIPEHADTAEDGVQWISEIVRHDTDVGVLVAKGGLGLEEALVLFSQQRRTVLQLHRQLVEGEQVPYLSPEHVGLDGLHDIVDRSELVGPPHGLVFTSSGDENDRRRSVELFAKKLDRGEPVELRHADSDQEQRKGLASQ